MNIGSFNLPIHYLDKKTEISSSMINDLELDSSETTLYNHVFNPTSDYAKAVIPQWNKYYSHDTHYIKDTQLLLTNYTSSHEETDNSFNFDDFNTIWNGIRKETGFNEKYHYIDIPQLEMCNKMPRFLLFLSAYNLFSPVLSLLVPILLLIVPFFIIKLQSIDISFHTYINVLKKIATQHSLGKLLYEFDSVTWDKRIYLIMSAVFYFIQIFQNIVTCRNFYQNLFKIQNYLHTTKKYIYITIQNMNNLLKHTTDLSSYERFNNDINKNKSIILDFDQKLQCIKCDKWDPSKFAEVGNLLETFYCFYKNTTCLSAFQYSFGLNGYIENISNLQNNIREKLINKCSLNHDTTSFTNAFYPSLLNKGTIIKNNYDISNNYIITGPNAAGKTTLLKTTLFNIILSQQIGSGFYSKANVSPYKFIHCYLNIPDTSGRDSLFQAEARRCKEILMCILDNPNDKHFCIFDELYSGTNPYEATSSAYAFLLYLTKLNNVNFMLTTHYIKLCKSLKKNKCITNYHMQIELDGQTIKYKYKLKKGISDLKGGLVVLKDLEYPKEIVDIAVDYLNKN